MTKFYATLTNGATGKQIEIGANSEKDLYADIRQMEKIGLIDQSWTFDVRPVTIPGGADCG